MAAASISMQGPAVGDWGIISLAISPVTARAAIAADVSVSGTFANSATSLTQTATLGASANYLLAGVLGDSASDLVTGVTYNSVAMTQLVKLYPGSTVGWLYVYGLPNPATGSSHNLVVSASGTCSTIGVTAQSYTNCSATQPNVQVSAAFKAINTAWSVLVPLTPGCWGVSFLRYSASGSPRTQTCTSCGTVAALRTSEGTNGVLSIVDTNGTIPLLTPTTLTPNRAQWRLQRADLGRRREQHLGS